MAEQLKTALFTAEAFVEWAMDQPAGRYELFQGEVVSMAPERVAHARVKKEVVKAFDAALAARGSGCEAFGDGMAVRVDERTVYEPDAHIRCGPRAGNDAVFLNDPVVVVEVVSPSSRGLDTGLKLADYFRLPSLRSYLVVQTDARRVIHHRRGDGDEILTRIVGDGERLALDPPGIEIAVADFFATL